MNLHNKGHDKVCSPFLSIPQPLAYGSHQDSSVDSSRTVSEHNRTGKADEAFPLMSFPLIALYALLASCTLRPMLTHTCAAGSLFGQMALYLDSRFVCVSCSVMSNSLWPHGLWPARLLCPWNFPGKSTGVGCHFLLLKVEFQICIWVSTL